MPNTVALDTLVELSPSARTRLIPYYNSPDLTHLYVTSFLTLISCVITILCLNESGLEPTTSTVASVSSSFLLLSLNAFYGLKAYKQLKYFRDIQYSEYVNRLNEVRTHERLTTSNIGNSNTSPVWKENVKQNHHIVLT